MMVEQKTKNGPDLNRIRFLIIKCLKNKLFLYDCLFNAVHNVFHILVRNVRTARQTHSDFEKFLRNTVDISNAHVRSLTNNAVRQTLNSQL